VTASAPPTGVYPVAIAGLGIRLPDRVVTNDDLAQVMDTSDEWIRSRTGIRERRVAAPEEATSDLAAAAARAALDDAGMTVDEVAAFVVATTSPDHAVAATAPLAAAALGSTAPAFDLNAACSGFVYALRVAAGLVDSGPVVVVGAETLTRVVDPEDRSVAVLFGDGAGAVVLVRDETARLGPFAWGADGAGASMLWTASGGTRRPFDAEVLADRSHYLSMRGGDVYRNAVARMTESAKQVLEAADLGVDDVSLLVGHQANVRILDAVASRLGVPAERCQVSLDRHGNTSAASIPLALWDARDQGRLHDGDHVLLTAFGAGLTWGASLVTWKEQR
jgi:3-oxoacyl-[acyl-carrier-protein] synthase III